MLRRGVAAALALAVAGAARGQAFSPPINVSQSASGSYLPSLVQARFGPEAGTMRMFWHDFTGGPAAIWCADTVAGTWSAGAACTPTQGTSQTPRAATDGLGRTHVVFRGSAAGQEDIFYSLRDGTAWSAPLNLSMTAARSRNPVIAIDPWDRPHVLFEEEGPGGVTFYEVHHTGTAWSAAADTGLPFVQAAFLDTMRIAVDGAGTLHAAWHDGATSVTEVYHAERPDGGAWSARANLSLTPSSQSETPAIACGADDSVHVAWVEQDAVSGLFQEICWSTRPAGGAWSPRIDLTSLRSQVWTPSIVVGADLNPRVAFSAGPMGDREVLYLPAPGASLVDVSLSPGVDSWRCTLILDDVEAPHVAWIEGSAPTPEIFMSGVAAAAPVLLFVSKDEAAGDVLLDWTGGAAPFTVSRAGSPGAALPWPEISPAGGVASPAFVDAGVLRDGNLWCYSVR